MTTPSNTNKEWLGEEFIITREFDAPRELVFKAWTDPKLLAQWWGPRGFTNPVCQWDARPGGKIYDVMRAPNGADFPMGGEFRELAPPERIVLTCGALDEQGNPLFEFLHSVTLTERNGKTLLTIRSRVTMTTSEANHYIGGFETGMTLSLDRLGDLMGRKSELLVVERLLDAPVAVVWRALATREEMSRWYFELAEFKPEEGFEFQFVVACDGVRYDHRCKITDVIPEKRIAYTWRYEGFEGDSLVSFELVAEGAKTRLVLTHDGIESFPKTPSFSRESFIEGWTQIIGSSLKDYAENAVREIVISREIDAPRELVWEAMTTPRHVVNWWGPRGFSTTIEEMDLRVGGTWRQVMHGPDGVNYPNEHLFKEIVKPGRLVFSQSGKREAGPGANFEATWSFEEVAAGKTKATIRMVFATASERDFVVKEFGALEGGRQTLERLGEYLAIGF